MNELNSIKTIKEIAALEGKAVDDKEVKAIYEKVANTYIDTILSKEASNETKIKPSKEASNETKIKPSK